jgi:hypothetical protein
MGQDASFMGTDAEGLPSPAFNGEDGTYHIPGSLSVPPAPAVKKILSNCGFDRKAVQQGQCCGAGCTNSEIPNKKNAAMTLAIQTITTAKIPKAKSAPELGYTSGC